MNIQFAVERDTKNATRFQEILEPGQTRGIVGTLYVLKSALAELEGYDPAKGLVVTITPL